MGRLTLNALHAAGGARRARNAQSLALNGTNGPVCVNEDGNSFELPIAVDDVSFGNNWP